jgi:type III pantothenate kinase
VKLLMDIGNARLKWAVLDEHTLSAFRAIEHEGDADVAVGEVIRTLSGVIEEVWISNVAGPAVAAQLRKTLRENLGVEPVFARTAATAYGIRCAYVDPARLGVDRWVAMIAAHAYARAADISVPVCVIDAGTAATLDVLDGDGQHIGGLILAGPKLIAAALRARTSGIDATILAAPRPRGLALLGRSTETAVGNGAWLSLAAALDRAVGVVLESLGPTHVLLTGGDGPTLAQWLDTDVEYREGLVLEGLAFMSSH